MKAIDLFQSQLTRTIKLLDIHKSSYPKGRPVKEGEAADLLRMVVVFAVAALDAYMHIRIVECVSRIMNKYKRLPEKCVNLICGKFKQAEQGRELIKIALKRSPGKALLGMLRRDLAFETLQKPEQINSAFEMMEISDPWNRIAKLVNLKRGPKRKGRKESARKCILELVRRRDDIVHEGDVYIGRKHHGKVKEIQRSEVKNNLTKLQRIVEAIEKISE